MKAANSSNSKRRMSDIHSTTSSNTKQKVDKADSITVICRFRPSTSTQNLLNPTASPFDLDSQTQSVTYCSEYSERKTFTFDKLFGTTSIQEDIFREVEGTVDAVMTGFNGTILAYGQTSAGKSWTMEGALSAADEETKNRLSGVTPRAVDKLFALINEAPTTTQFQIKISYYEIYCERVRDLLNPAGDNLKTREVPDTGFQVQDLTELYCGDRDAVMRAIHMGKANRASAPTLMNADSSRSHSIASLTLRQTDESTGRSLSGRLFLVDLAGSEKVSKTGASGARLEEAKNINRSLTTLGMVITALCEGAPHVPYRDSKLTRLLMDSLGGNSRTTMIICCSPDSAHVPETLSTLRFGERAKRIENHARVNEELTAGELKRLLTEAQRELVAMRRALADAVHVSSSMGTQRAQNGVCPACLGNVSKTSLAVDRIVIGDGADPSAFDSFPPSPPSPSTPLPLRQLQADVPGFVTRSVLTLVDSDKQVENLDSEGRSVAALAVGGVVSAPESEGTVLIEGQDAHEYDDEFGYESDSTSAHSPAGHSTGNRERRRHARLFAARVVELELELEAERERSHYAAAQSRDLAAEAAALRDALTAMEGRLLQAKLAGASGAGSVCASPLALTGRGDDVAANCDERALGHGSGSEMDYSGSASGDSRTKPPTFPTLELGEHTQSQPTSPLDQPYALHAPHSEADDLRLLLSQQLSLIEQPQLYSDSLNNPPLLSTVTRRGTVEGQSISHRLSHSPAQSASASVRLEQLREEYDTYIRRLMTKLVEEQQHRSLLEEKLRMNGIGVPGVDTCDSSDYQDRDRAGKSSANSSPDRRRRLSTSGMSFFSLFGFASGRSGSPNRRDREDGRGHGSGSTSSLARSLEVAQSRTAQLASELQAVKEANAVVLETKTNMVESLVRQNAALTKEHEAQSARLEQLQSQVGQLTQLLRSACQPLSSNPFRVARGGATVGTGGVPQPVSLFELAVSIKGGGGVQTARVDV